MLFRIIFGELLSRVCRVNVSDTEFLRGGDLTDVTTARFVALPMKLEKVLRNFFDGDEGYFLFDLHPFGGLIALKDGRKLFIDEDVEVLRLYMEEEEFLEVETVRWELGEDGQLVF